ncbi:DUF3373 family protein [Sulfurimonas sp. SAG-AH-194-C20]|nr:DUF3373 family protein [Sulfurimonas sp. SAG-AH-194-C20]MDF1878289.1 DUF3373 family protein [Sulfurimonas sp. SAG-AH-194-C20]
MNKPLLLSLAAATILTSSLNAESMYERIQSMELKMKQMQEELVTLKSKDTQAVEEEVEEEADEDADDEEATTAEDADSEDEDSDSEDDDSEDSDDEDEDEEITIEERIAEMEESIFELSKATNGSHLKFNIDYRVALDNLQYKMADGSEQGNNAFLTNRFWINMSWKATDNLSFSGQLAYNKAFGERSNSYGPLESFDWVENENPAGHGLNIRSAYFLYKNDTFLGSDIPWTFSIGRRPSTNGHLINLREDDGASSPMGHTINVEFDGISSKFSLEDVIGVEGMYVKFCAGRGMTNASDKFSPAPYDGTDGSGTNTAPSNPDIDLGGLIFVPYDDGQYAVATQYYYANNLIDVKNPGDFSQGFDTVGGIHSVTANLTLNGIGDEWSDYLDDTFFFVSGAMSVTNPLEGKSMLGRTDSVTGYSAWAGLQMPSFITEDGRWGLEYNQGSKYWRSITYAEDTSIGSKVATRGQAYEVYFTEPIVEDILTFQIRATYIDYKYAGSNGFFGGSADGSTGTGTPFEISDTMGNSSLYVDTAQDIRFYLRYRY